MDKGGIAISFRTEYLRKITAVVFAGALVLGGLGIATAREGIAGGSREEKKYDLLADNQILFSDHNDDGLDDLFIIQKTETVSMHVEVHVLSGASNYRSYLSQAVTNLAASSQWEFLLGDYNQDGTQDLYCLLREETEQVLLLILDGSNHYETVLFERSIEIKNDPDQTGSFEIEKTEGVPDLYFIKQAATQSGQTEVHIIGGSAEYQQFILHTETALAMTDDGWQFMIHDFNGDGTADLYAAARNSEQREKTEVHVLDGAAGFKEFLLQAETEMADADEFTRFLLSPVSADLYAVNIYNTESGCVEINYLPFRPESSLKTAALEEAKRYIGLDYVWGGENLSSGVDCSGFVKVIYEKFGIVLPHSSYLMRSVGAEIQVSEMEPGDLVCYEGHIGFYAGEGKLLSALGSKYGVTYNSVNYKNILTVRRME